jgi:hypothetical protein
MAAILVMAKSPEAGRVKTRLCPPLTPERACLFHEALLLDTLDLVRGLDLVRFVAHGGPGDWFERHAPDFERFAQCGADLGERLHCALTRVLALHSPVLCIGSDSPHLPPERFARARALLATHPVVFGPALDGGYYLVGLDRPWDLFCGMPMGTDRLLAETLARCTRLGLAVGLLEAERDVDTWADVEAVGARFGAGHTARLLARWRSAAEG